MCIRDRFHRLPAEGENPLPGGDLLGTFGDHEKRLSHGPLPVSYTHLRAHETVLDLVCRLLHEKKKQHDKNYRRGEAAIRDELEVTGEM